MIRRLLPAFCILIVLCAFVTEDSFTGTWEYSGGIYNGKPQQASKDYKLQRKYDTEHYQALFIEPGAEPIPYEKGNYVIKQDTCFETQTFSAEPSKLLNITLKYHYQVKNDTLTFNGVLPNGTTVQEYWKRVK